MGEPTPPGQPDVEQLLSAVKDSVRKVDASELRGEVRVLKKSELRKLITDLVEKYGSSDIHQLMQRRDELTAGLEKAGQRHEQMQELLTGGKQGLDKYVARNEAARKTIELFRVEGEQTVAQRRRDLVPHEEQVQWAQTQRDQALQGTGERGQRIAALEQEVAQLESALGSDAQRARVRDLEVQFRGLDERVRQLQAAADFFAVEEVWGPEAFDEAYQGACQAVEAAGPKLAGDEAKSAKVQALREALEALNGQVGAESGKLENLLEQMHDGKAGTRVVMDIIAKTRTLAHSRDELETLASTLGVLTE